MPYVPAYRQNAAIRRGCAIGLVAAALAFGAGCGVASVAGDGDDLASAPRCDGFACDPNGCNTTGDCTKGLKCDPKSHTCVACVADMDCPAGQICAPNHLCATGCSAGHNCAAGGGVCEADAGMCVPCLGDGDCADPKNSRCDPASHTCFPCYPQNDNCGHATYCASTMKAYACAAGCKNDADCPANMLAQDGGGQPDGGGGGGMSHCEKGSHACVECLGSDDCPAGKVCSNGHACVGGCTNTHPCAGGRSCCTGSCVDVSTDTGNCGGCGNACKAGFNCCNSNCSDPAGDVNNCNGCGLGCKVPHAKPACTMKSCTVGLCDSGFGDCDGAAANGCEVDLNADPTHCGSCMTACMLAHASPKCASGVCQIAMCAAGFGDCNQQSADGCEVNLLGGDLGNCGACGSVCTVANGMPLCAMGLCKVGMCNMGYSDCDKLAANGCEVRTSSDISNCGSCGNVCSNVNGAPSCAAGVCQIACNQGYADCNNNVADGCEVNLNVDVTNCGGCARVCNLPHANASCAAGLCKISTCTNGYTDCNGLPADGCEVNLNTDAKNCGKCAVVCPNAQTCSNGACNGAPQQIFTVCGFAAPMVFAGGNCSNNTAQFADWWCQLAGFTKATSYTTVSANSLTALYYNGGQNAVLSSCNQVMGPASYGFNVNCTGASNLFCQ